MNEPFGPTGTRVILLFSQLIWLGCVPLQQQVAEQERAAQEINGFIGPLVIDEAKFDELSATRVYDRYNVPDELLPFNNDATYEATFGGKMVYIRNCKCLKDVRIIQDNLAVTHSHGGGESNRESTMLLWNGKHYRNTKGEYIADVMVYSDKIDIRRGYWQEKKIFDIAGLQVKEAQVVWIKVVGYNGEIQYNY